MISLNCYPFVAAQGEQWRLTASSYAARRHRQATVHSRAARQAMRPDFSAASRVSISELLGAIDFTD